MNFLSMIILFVIAIFIFGCDATAQSAVFRDDISMPSVTPNEHDQYLCTAKRLDSREAYIIQYEAHSADNRAHHILLFGCSGLSAQHRKMNYWECLDGSICQDQKIMFAWAKNAPPTHLPTDVGFRTGGNSGVNYLVLEIHYAHPLNESDNSGLTLYTTYQPQKYIAGIHLMLAMYTKIPPNTPVVHSDINCPYESKVPIHPFAYRVHAHSLGVVISGYKYNVKSGKWTLLGKGNPNWPQAFYPMETTHTIQMGDYLVAQCTYNSTGRHRTTFIGSTAEDEMCNFYIMYYTDAEYGTAFGECMDVSDLDLVQLMPKDSDTPLPRNRLLEEHAHGGIGNHHSGMQHSEQHKSMGMQHPPMIKKGHTYSGYTPILDNLYSTEYSEEEKNPKSDESKIPEDEIPHRGKVNHAPQVESRRLQVPTTQLTSQYSEVQNWPTSSLVLGQVSAVAVDSQGKVILFHRGSRVWDARSFDIFNNFANPEQGPILEDTIVELDKKTGSIVNKWGANIFFMPHGLSLDKDKNVWVTDVALHQIMKFPPGGSRKPLLTLGERLKSGNDNTHFCKPTSVAVTSTGEFFVADGYCNSRVMKYSANGIFLLQFGKRTLSILGYQLGVPPPYAFSIPHKLALAEDKGLLCVADRENGRIQCFSIANGTFHSVLALPEFGAKLFAVAYTSTNNGQLLAVNGAEDYKNPSNVKGFVLDINSGVLRGLICPIGNEQLHYPHDIAVSSDGSTVYISEIGPNRVWKFVSNSAVVTPTALREVARTTPFTPESIKAIPMSQPSSFWSGGSLTPTLVVIALLAIPVLLVIFVTVLIRLKKHGTFRDLDTGHVKGWMSGYRQPSGDKLNLGNFLNPHKGFDPVSLEESDAASSDSDVEEFSVQKA